MYKYPEKYTQRAVIRNVYPLHNTGNIIVNGDTLTFLQTYLADDFSHRDIPIDDMNPTPNIEITVKYGERSYTILCDKNILDALTTKIQQLDRTIEITTKEQP